LKYKCITLISKEFFILFTFGKNVHYQAIRWGLRRRNLKDVMLSPLGTFWVLTVKFNAYRSAFYDHDNNDKIIIIIIIICTFD
jgi:hypothetical protein